jgi:hypothetical protein
MMIFYDGEFDSRSIIADRDKKGLKVEFRSILVRLIVIP